MQQLWIEKDVAQRGGRIRKRWARLVRGLALRQRLDAEASNDLGSGGAHVHAYGATRHDPESGAVIKTCSCGLEITVEEV